MCRWFADSLLTALLLAAVVSCGIRTDPRPPEATMPERPANFSALIENDEVRLRWSRPTESTDGRDLYDLAGFVIERGDDGEEFAVIAEVPVNDRNRVRPQNIFKWRDLDPVAGRSFYRVRAFTRDGQTGSISAGTPIEVPTGIVEHARKLRAAQPAAPDTP